MEIAVIGAGPSGMMAAIEASKNAKVTLFEKNEKLGKKLYITGKGRCNITNYCEDENFFENIIRNRKFMYSSYYSFNNFQTMKFFEDRGLKLKIERGNRVFPNSDKSSDIIKVYERYLIKNSVDIKLNTKVKSIEKIDDRFIINHKYEFDKIIIATGGISYVATGSDGDGYKFATHFGHKIIDLKPGLIAMRIKDKDLNELTGLSLKNVELSAYSKKKKINSLFGEMMFTHFGITGPIVLSMSSYINRLQDIDLFLDLKPALTEEKLDKRILKDFDKNLNKNIKNCLKELLPKDLIEIILKKSNIDSKEIVNQISKEKRMSLIKNIKNFKLNYDGLFNFNTAIITSGGIDTKEVDPSTLESKLVKGLYFCGEILDVDALTGGYNLQIANSTGYLAGSSASGDKI